MANRTFKIVGRDRKTERQKKKRVYTSEKDYLRYKDDLIKRYKHLMDVEGYELIDDKWELIFREECDNITYTIADEIFSQKTNDTNVVFGTIGIDGGKYFVEVFKEIHKEYDLNFLSSISLRARINAHRNYQGFYFKTNDFVKLKKHFDEDNESFANWVKETESVKYVEL